MRREEGALGATIGHKRRPVSSELSQGALDQADHYTQHGSNIPTLAQGRTREYL